jgi:hypothetical protein
MKLRSVLALAGVAVAASWLLSSRRRIGESPSGLERSGDAHPDLEAELTSALEDTFPASDPIAVGWPTALVPDRPLHRQPATVDKRSLERLAEQVDRKRGGQAG